MQTLNFNKNYFCLILKVCLHSSNKTKEHTSLIQHKDVPKIVREPKDMPLAQAIL